MSPTRSKSRTVAEYAAVIVAAALLAIALVTYLNMRDDVSDAGDEFDSQLEQELEDDLNLDGSAP